MRRRGSVIAERADARRQPLAAIDGPRERRVFATRHVAELAAAPVDRHGVGVVGIRRLADEVERFADCGLPRRPPRRDTETRRAASSAPPGTLLRVTARANAASGPLSARARSATETRTSRSAAQDLRARVASPKTSRSTRPRAGSSGRARCASKQRVPAQQDRACGSRCALLVHVNARSTPATPRDCARLNERIAPFARDEVEPGRRAAAPGSSTMAALTGRARQGPAHASLPHHRRARRRSRRRTSATGRRSTTPPPWTAVRPHDAGGVNTAPVDQPVGDPVAHRSPARRPPQDPRRVPAHQETRRRRSSTNSHGMSAKRAPFMSRFADRRWY